MSTQPAPVEVFCSYAHEDESWLWKLESHASPLKQQGLISFWYDRLIPPGTNWARTIDTHLETASVILLLVSADFFASDYCVGIEMKRALERQEGSEALVIPILVGEVDWREAPLAHLQALPTDAKPLTLWSDEEIALADVVAGIRRAIETLPLLAASAPRAALPSVWNIPYPRNPFFLGRETELVQVHRHLQAGQAVAFSQPQAISGLGGVGKSQVALEYAYRYHQDYQAVLWVRAESTEALVSSYLALATLLRLSEREEQDQRIVIQAVKRWLQTHRGWLLILDNADELALVPDFLPPTPEGHLLLTTRATATEGLAQRLEIETFLPEQGAVLLLRRAGLIAPDATLSQASAPERDVALQISQELGGLPLALDQAGAYLEATGTNLADYWHLYQQYRANLLRERRSLIPDHPEPVATTWSLSFQRVEAKNPAAAELLRLCAFLAPDAIAEEIVVQGSSHLGPVLSPVAADAFLLNQAIEVLCAYSLVRRDPKEKTFSVHRLVQAVIRDAMTSSEWAQWHERAIQSLNAVFPEGTVTGWPQCERLLSHVLVAATYASDETGSIELVQCLRKTGTYLVGRAQYGEAEPLLQRAWQVMEQLSNPDPAERAFLLNNLGLSSFRQGKYDEAEPLFRQALEIIEGQLGSDHPLEATTLSNLGLIYFRQEKYDEAEPLFHQALQIIEDQLGSDNPLETLLLGNLGTLYLEQGRYADSEPLLERAMQTLNHAEGFVHNDFALVLANVGLMYIQQHKYAEAEPLLQRALQIGEQQLGSNHPNVAVLLINLAQLYCWQDKYAEAEPLLRRALQFWEQRTDVESIYVIVTLSMLGYVYREQSKYQEAEALLQYALQIVEHQFGPEHLRITDALTNLADLYKAQQKYAQAESLYQRALQIREQKLGPDDLDVATSLNNLANFYYHQRYKRAKAEPLYQRVLQIREQKLGPDDLDVATSLNNLANFYYSEQVLSIKAEPLYQRALQIREQKLSADHPDIAVILNNLARLYRDQGRYAAAEPLYQRALQIREQKLGPEHSATLGARKDYATLRGCRNVLYGFLALLSVFCFIIWLFHKFDLWGWIAFVLTILSGLRLAIGGYEYFSGKRERETNSK